MYQDIFNSATIEGMVAAPGSKWHRDPPDVIPLWLAEPDFPVAMEIKKALLNAVQDEDLFYNGDIPARTAMSEKINRVNGLNTTIEDIMITQGVTPGMWVALRHATNEGDDVVVTNPMYGPFFNAVNVTNCKQLHWNLSYEEGYKFDIEELKKLITPRTKLIFVCNPHNPCGRRMTEEELKGIADVAVDHNIEVFSDDLHEDIIFDGKKHITLASLNPEIEALTMTSWGFSKTFCVAGLQIGYLCSTNKEVMADIRKQASGAMRGTSTLSKAAVPVMCSTKLDWWRRDIMTHYHKTRELAYKRLDEMGISYPKLEATYLMYPKFDWGMTCAEIDEFLFKEARVRLSQGTNFGSNGEGHMRMSIASSMGIMTEAFDRMEKAVSKLK
ncbi:MAG TPA: pyridoxal phosphate-dependent aminotransferase [Patescibacteria group bacterium]|nr:pyridoxal phosphate-dependent aminotransferase [Patescibacteria group bacterium]